MNDTSFGNTYNVNDLPEGSGFTPLPAGDYTVLITNSEKKATKAGTGYYWEIHLDVQDGSHAGRMLIERLNLVNPNEKAVEIAHETLGAICKAVGLQSVSDTKDLHGKRVKVAVVVEEGKPYTKDGVQKEGSPQNAIKRYLPVGVATPQASAAPSATVAEPAAAASADVPAWRRKA